MENIKFADTAEADTWISVVNSVIQNSGMPVMEMSDNKKGILIKVAEEIADGILESYRARW